MSVLSRAVAYWKALDYSGSGALLDGSGNGHDAQLGSTGGADTNDPLFLDYDDGQYLYLSGVEANYASSPDSAALDITGDIDLRVLVQLDSYSGASGSQLLTKEWLAYRFQLEWENKLKIMWTSEDGAEGLVSTAVTDIANAAKTGLRVTLDVDNGAGDAVAMFYKSTNGVDWTQIGDPVLLEHTTEIVADANPLRIGTGWNLAGIPPGRYYRAQVYDGIDGTLVFDAVPADVVEPYATFTERSVNAATVTIHRSATGKKAEIVNQKLFLGGTDDRMEVADHADLDFAADESFTIVYAGRTYDPTPAADQVLIAKKADLTTGAGYVLYIDTTGTVNALIADGTNSSEDTIAGLAAGENFVVALRRDVAADELEVFLDGVGSGSPTPDATTATLANALDLFISSISGGGSYLDGSKFGAAVFAEALSDADIASAGSELLVTTVVLSAALASFAAPATSTQLGAVTAVLSPAVATFSAPAVTVTNVICELVVFSNFSLTFPTFSSVSLSFPELTSVTVEF